MTIPSEGKTIEARDGEIPPLRKAVPDGSVLCRRFRIQGGLGTPGTIAFSVRATDLLTNEEVVCKIPRRGDECLFQSLLDQYRFMRALKSQRLPAVLGYFREEEAARGEPFPFLVMEFVPGEQAETWRSGRSARDKLRMFLDVVDAIADLNDRGVEHGDVHLRNILVDAQGRAVLIDPDSQAFGSTLRARMKKEGSRVDLACLRHCLGALVEDENQNVAAGVLERLRRDDIKVPTAREIAVVLRSTLNSKLLPGESNESLDDSASRYRNEKAASVEVYRRNRDIRDMEFRKLRDLLKPMAEKFGFKVETNLSDGLLGLDSVVKPEEESESTPHGRFEHRQLTCHTPDGDRLFLCFDGVYEFRRPWPTDVPGLLAKGLLSVVFRGAQQAILVRQLELWFRQGMTSLVFREPERFVYIDGSELEHALRVLSGDIYPGIPEPLTPRQAVAPLEDLQALVAQRQVLQRLRIPYAQAGRPRQKDKMSLGMAMLKLVLELSPERAPYKILGTRFHEMMAIPMQKRHQFVAEETGKVTAFLRNSMKVVRRFDIRPNDSSGHVLFFDIDAVMDCGAVRTTLRSDNSVRHRKVEVQSIEIVAPKDPFAQLRSPKGKKRRLPPK